MGLLSMITGQGKIIRLFEEAAGVLLADKHRKGDIVSLPPQGDLILTGDIHGNLANYEEIVNRAALDTNPQRHLVLHELIHDFCNRGRDFSYEILQEAAKLKIAHPDQVHIFLGNHELAELEGEAIRKDGRTIPLVFSESRMKSLGGIGGEIREAAKKFFLALPVGLKTPANVWFSHSTPAKAMHQFNLGLMEKAISPKSTSVITRGDAMLKAQVIKDLVWGRDHSVGSAATFAGKVGCDVLVVGHEFAVDGILAPNTRHLILDSTRENACILHLKLDQRYTHRQCLERVQYLKPTPEFTPEKLKALKLGLLQKLYPAAPARPKTA
mgnify:CR=1 FL=1